MKKKNIETCMVCLNDEIIEDNKIKVKKLEKYLDIIKCIKCKNLYHKICIGLKINNDKDFICCNIKNKKCNFCKNTKGYLFQYDINLYGHKLCLFIKNYFLSSIKNMNFQKNYSNSILNKNNKENNKKNRKKIINNEEFYLCECCCCWISFKDFIDILEDKKDLDYRDNEFFLCFFCYLFLKYFEKDSFPKNIKKFKNLKNINDNISLKFFKNIHIEILTLYLEENYKTLDYEECNLFIKLFFKMKSEENNIMTIYNVFEDIFNSNSFSINFIKNYYIKVTEEQIIKNNEKLNKYYLFINDLIEENSFNVYIFMKNKIEKRFLFNKKLFKIDIQNLININNLIKDFIINGDYLNYIKIKKFNELTIINKVKNNIFTIEKSIFPIIKDINFLLSFKNKIKFNEFLNYYIKFKSLFNEKYNIIQHFFKSYFNKEVYNKIENTYLLNNENWMKYVYNKIQNNFNLKDNFFLEENIEEDIVYLEDIKKNSLENKNKFKKLYNDSLEFYNNKKNKKVSLNDIIKKKLLFNYKYKDIIKNLREIEILNKLVNFENTEIYDYEYIKNLEYKNKDNKKFEDLFKELNEIKNYLDLCKDEINSEEYKILFNYKKILNNYKINYRDFDLIYNKYNFFIEMVFILISENYVLDEFIEIDDSLLEKLENSLNIHVIKNQDVLILFNIEIKNANSIQKVKKFKTLIIQNYFMNLSSKFKSGKINYNVIILFIKSEINFTNSKLLQIKETLKENKENWNSLERLFSKINDIFSKKLNFESFDFMKNIIKINEYIKRIYENLEQTKRNILKFYNFSDKYNFKFKEEDFDFLYNLDTIINITIYSLENNLFVIKNYKFISNIILEFDLCKYNNQFINEFKKKELFKTIKLYLNNLIEKNNHLISNFHVKDLKYKLKIFFKKSIQEIVFNLNIPIILKENFQFFQNNKKYLKMHKYLKLLKQNILEYDSLNSFFIYIKMTNLGIQKFYQSKLRKSLKKLFREFKSLINMVFKYNYFEFNLNNTAVNMLHENNIILYNFLKNWNLFKNIKNIVSKSDDNYEKYETIIKNNFLKENDLLFIKKVIIKESEFLFKKEQSFFNSISDNEEENYKFLFILFYNIFNNNYELVHYKIWFSFIIIYYFNISKKLIFKDFILKKILKSLHNIYCKSKNQYNPILFIIRFMFCYENFLMNNDTHNDNYFNFISILCDNFADKEVIKKKVIKNFVEEKFDKEFIENIKLNEDNDFFKNFINFIRILE